MYRANLTPSKWSILKNLNGHKKIGANIHAKNQTLPNGNVFSKKKSVVHNLQCFLHNKNVEINQNYWKSVSVHQLLTSRTHQGIRMCDYTIRYLPQEENGSKMSKLQQFEYFEPEEIQALQKIYPSPFDALNGIYSKVIKEFNDECYNLQQIFTPRKISSGITHWDCTYHIKWPTEMLISTIAPTKRLAASQSALKVLHYLNQCGSLTDNNIPIFTNILKDDLMNNTIKESEELSALNIINNNITKKSHSYNLRPRLKIRNEKENEDIETSTIVPLDNNNQCINGNINETISEPFLTMRELAELSGNRLPNPASLLYNIYDTVRAEYKNPDYILLPSFLHKKVNNNILWICSYKLQWPKKLTFTDKGTTQNIASTKCATQILNYLSENKYLRKDLILKTKIIAEKLPNMANSYDYINEECNIPVFEDPQIKTRSTKKNVKVISTKVHDHFMKQSITGSNFQIKLLAKQLLSARAYSTSAQNDAVAKQETLTNAEMKKLHKLFPNPKNVLHSVYEVVSQELKNKNFKLTPLYSKVSSEGVGKWECMYYLKWPVDVQFKEVARTKQEASTKAALAVLNYLKLEGKLTKQKQPIMYDGEEVAKQKLKPLVLHRKAVRTMREMVDCYKSEFEPLLVDSVNEEGKEDVPREELETAWPGFKETSNRRFQDSYFYECKEVVKLPISDFKTDIMNLVKDNRVVVVKGEPGCGKSTRVPQYILESWAKTDRLLKKDCRIIVTQPRRIAAISLAERVAKERNEGVGSTIGYQVRLKSNFNNRTGHVLYCTTGILLRRLQSDPHLSDCTHVIIDEAHERDVNTDLLLNLLRRAVVTNPDLRLIIMSATIDAEKFKEYFESAALIHIPGFTYPVKVNFLSETKNLPKTMEMCDGAHPEVVCDDVVKLIKYIHKERGEGAILCFLPGWGDISKVNKMFHEYSGDLAVYCLHSRMQDSEQKLIFSKPPPGVRKVILATNIAETSVTIDDVVYVIDTGIQKDQRFDVEKGISCIDNRWISKSSMAQRKGRAGRVQSGESFHLYPESKFQTFEDYSMPEILRTSLTKIVLDSKVYSNNAKASEFLSQLLNPPETSAILKAVDELKELELLDDNENLTPLGRVISEFQLEPNLGKAMVNSVMFKCVTPIVDIVTLFSAETELFTGGLSQKEEVNRCKREFSKSSDHLSMMRILEKWLEYIDSDDAGMAQYFCRNNNLIDYKLYTIRQLRGIHFDYLNKSLLDVLPKSDNYSDNDELVKAVLLSGVGHVLQHRDFDIVKGRLKKTNVLLTRNNHKATISSDSVNCRRTSYPTNFLLYINETRSNIRRITTVRETSLVSPLTVLLFKNNKLIIKEVPEKYLDENKNKEDYVLLKLENTNIECICDKTEAELVKEFKECLNSAMHYYIFQMTKGGECNEKINSTWDNILRQLDEVLMLQGIDNR